MCTMTSLGFIEVEEMEDERQGNVTIKEWSERCNVICSEDREAMSEESSSLWKLEKGKKKILF